MRQNSGDIFLDSPQQAKAQEYLINVAQVFSTVLPLVPSLAPGKVLQRQTAALKPPLLYYL